MCPQTPTNLTVTSVIEGITNFKYYQVYTSQHDWIHIITTQSRANLGGLFVNGSYGSYAYEWGNTGRDDFRTFLIELSPDYLYHKLAPNRQVYDSEKSYAAVLRMLREEYEDNPEELADQLSELSEEFNNVYSEDDFSDWLANSELDNASECYCTDYEPQCWIFCSKIFPALQEHLKSEIAHIQSV